MPGGKAVRYSDKEIRGKKKQVSGTGSETGNQQQCSHHSVDDGLGLDSQPTVAS